MGLTLESFLPYRLNRIAEAVGNEIRPVYKDTFGLNRPEWRVLAALADIGPATATEIGAHSTQHKTKVSRAVTALEQRRWLTRETDPNDRRSEILSLTAKGQRAYCDLVEPMRQCEAGILDRLDAEDRTALEKALDALETTLDLRKRG
ncbi:MarR family winged helix-turn-helix transcriptional regulator [Oricola sp.]|uniref:MarR family winged helix-turn-helix transcriptional regulator n=1 Tax=Oricola sp. TaxID=1979950 RepID=UPI003BA985A6